MIHSDDDNSAKPSFDNFESLAERRKLRPVMKSKNICFKRSRGQLHINNMSSSTTTDTSRSSVYHNDFPEDSELKLTLMNLLPRNTAQETSEGVQELIKHVSEFIGKKNPFKDRSSNGRKERSETSRPSSRHSIRPHPSKDTTHSSRKSKTTGEDRKVNPTAQSSAGKCFSDKVDSSTSESKSKSFSYASRRSAHIRKRLIQTDSNCEPIKENQAREKSFCRASRISLPKGNTGKNNPNTERATNVGYRTQPGIPGKISATKKLKPSEIPLRKNRTNASKVKQTSQATMKTATEANTTTSTQVNTNRKSGASTSQEIQHCVRDIDKENRESSPNLPKDKPKTTDKDAGKCDPDNSRDLHSSRSTKNSNIAELSNHLPRARMLDLEQVRSSTFTVLTSLTNTLHRLESIHQQNVGIKENGSDKILGSKSSKLKVLTPKSSFSLLKAKGSKKSLSSRLSSKGNKPSLKNKKRKSKTEIGINRTSTFHENIKTPPRGSSQSVQNVAKPISQTSRLSTPKNQNLQKEKQSQKSTSAKKTDQSSRGSGFSRPKVVSPNATPPKNAVGVTPAAGFNQKLLVNLCRATSNQPEDDSTTLYLDPFVKSKESSDRISSSSDDLRAVSTPINWRKSDAVITEGSTKIKHSLPALIEGQSKCKTPEGFKSELKTKPKSKGDIKVKKSRESSRVPVKELEEFGTAAEFPEVTTPNKPEELESEKVQLKITIDVNSQEDCSLSEKNKAEDGKNVSSFNWLFMNQMNYGQECEQQLSEKRKPEQEEVATKKDIVREPESPPSPLNDIVAESVKDNLAVSNELESELEKRYRGSQMMKRRPRPKYKTPVMNVKTIGRKMKTRSDPGNRYHFSSDGHFNFAIHFQNKMNKTKTDTKLRSGLTRSFNRDINIGSDARDHFDDVNSDKLKRRNSEPFSFRGFIWRHHDTVPPRNNKASASSLGSSLKHLNTDDLEDFIFWESVPPRVTSCWETSLYHFKRPWSVLSCSVFKDNRLSNTPDLILESIRNGSSSVRRWPASQETERVSNSFDVEPSITQKNIDVRNWLAALNFQSPPSTSSDIIREGSASSQTVTVSQEFKSPVVQRRRKVFPGLKLSESDENKISKESDKYNSEGSDIGLMELIRRKSGGFVTAEQYFNSTRAQSYASHGKSNHRHKSKPKFQVLEDLEDSDVEKFTDSKSNISKEEKMVQVAFGDFVSLPSPPSVELLKNPSSRQDEEATPPQSSPSLMLRKFLRGDTEVFTSNVWKYLFMFTLFVLVTYYVSRSRYSCRL